MCYNKNMEHSIDTVKQTPETMRIAPVAKTYELPEEVSLGPEQSVRVGGFVARGRIDGKSAVVALDNSDDPKEMSDGDSVVQQYLEGVVLEDLPFMRSAYYNHIARLQGMTTPNVLKVTPDDQKKLKSAGLFMDLANGSLEKIEEEQNFPAGLVVSRGDALEEVSDIEDRAEEIGQYSRAAVHFPGDKPGVEEECIILTDAAGNQIVMPSQEETTELLERLFGYKESDN